MDHNDHNVWHEANLEKFTADGRAVLRYKMAPHATRMVDLLKERYRWLQGQGLPRAASAA